MNNALIITKNVKLFCETNTRLINEGFNLAIHVDNISQLKHLLNTKKFSQVYSDDEFRQDVMSVSSEYENITLEQI